MAAYLSPEAPPVWWSFGICVGLGSVALIVGTVVYFRRRRPIILPFSTGLLVFLLARVSALMGDPWQLLWWYSYLLYFGGLILVAYGVLEGQRVREREELIGRLEDLTSQLEEQSLRDPLTGAYNRRHLMNALESEFKRALRGRLPLTLLVCDVDGFKDVNDSHGHPCGDFVLKEIARRLGDSVRLSDVVGRCGGEEFWILLPQTNRLGGQGVANKTLETIRQPLVWEDQVLTVTMSIGIADTLSPAARDVPSLIHEADRALYMAKRAGKNRAIIVEPLTFSLPTQ
jgi:diguanylate cyclase (GGDEF)-like protein